MAEKTTVYTKTICGNCDKTKTLLDSLHVEYEVVNMEENLEVLQQIKALGFRAAPVVIGPKGAWSGHREDKIMEAFA